MSLKDEGKVWVCYWQAEDVTLYIIPEHAAYQLSQALASAAQAMCRLGQFEIILTLVIDWQVFLIADFLWFLKLKFAITALAILPDGKYI